MKNSTKIKIPKKYEPMLDEVYHDSDGYWAYSKDGFYFHDMDCHTAHEDSQKALLDVISSLKPCDCEDCKKALTDKEANGEGKDSP
jgi:hypothetical protein